MSRYLNQHSIKFLIALLLLIGLVAACFWPGLDGGFIFDDYHSLQKLTLIGGELNFEKIIEYLKSSDTGPLKRPLSVISFLFNAQDWPAEPWPFKATNLAIHVINAGLLFALIYQIFKLQALPKSHALYLALVASLLWGLHPYFVSTVLYVVQRMAMLPLTFTLLGMLFYLLWRVRYPGQSTKWLIIAVVGNGLFCTLAVLSKENGVLYLWLLPLFEWLICQKLLALKPLDKWSRFWLLWLPVVVLLLAFLVYIPLALQGYESRSFTLYERLLTECRAVMHYLNHLWLPRLFSEGVFMDAYAKSTSLFNPVSTLVSMILVGLLLTLSLLARNRYPWLAFALLFFFASQALESSFIPLELVFEHRAYLASIFLFVPLVYVIYQRVKSRSLQVIILGALLFIMAMLTLNKSYIWGDNLRLHLNTTAEYPESPRAALMAADILLRQGQTEVALQLLKEKMTANQALQIKYNYYGLKCHQQGLTQVDLERLTQATSTIEFTKFDHTSLHFLIEKLLLKQCGESVRSPTYALTLINAIKSNLFYQTEYGKRTTHGLLLYVYMALVDEENIVREFRILVNHGLPRETALQYIENLAEKSPEVALQLKSILHQNYPDAGIE